MTDTNRPRAPYAPTPRDGVEGCLAYFSAAVAHLQNPKTNPPPDIAQLFRGLPHGSIKEAFVQERPQGTVIGWRIGDRNPRFTVPTGFLMLRVLGFHGGFPFIDTNKKGGSEQHYVEVLAEGFTFQRIMVGAEPGEVVRLTGDHHDLLPWCMAIESTNPRAKRDRRSAIKLALELYDRNAADWGLSDLLTRSEFEALLRAVFRLYDAEHGRHHLRALAA